MTYHYEGADLIIRKIEVGDLENNTYVLECPESHDAFIVDGCFEAKKIVEGTTGVNVVAILQTHGHYDHVQALAALKEHFDVPVLAHDGDDYPVHVDRTLSDGQQLELGSRQVAVLHTPGHTPGSVCYRSGSHLISGDTLFPGGPGNSWGDKKAFEQIIGSIETKLFVLDDATAVYPGHGDDTTIGKEKRHLQEWIDRGW
jgi:glyoxylase-like metal-dependent hydrolase (beta-lactamase superfamily II)